MSSPDEKVRAAAVERLIGCNRMVARFPGSLNLIGMMQGVLDKPGRYPEARRFIVESMKAVCRSAQQLGIQVSLEPVNHMIVKLSQYGGRSPLRHRGSGQPRPGDASLIPFI